MPLRKKQNTKSDSGLQLLKNKYLTLKRSVIEYADSGAADGYQAGEEVQITDFSQVTWDPIFCNTVSFFLSTSLTFR